jgi:hypothetical protein
LWFFLKLVVSTKFYLNSNINIQQSLDCIIMFYVEMLFIFLDGEHHMFKWE